MNKQILHVHLRLSPYIFLLMTFPVGTAQHGHFSVQTSLPVIFWRNGLFRFSRNLVGTVVPTRHK
jgi:hypothetical protein